MQSLLLTFDLERFILAEDFCQNFGKTQSTQIAIEGLENLISLLEDCNARATFFVSYDFSQSCKKQLKHLVKLGNEIALHGYSHSDNYAEMPKDDAIEIISSAKKNLEKTFSVKVNGFRAPRMRGPSNSVLRQCGLSFDSSLHPTFLPGSYNNFFKPRKPFTVKGVTVVPVSVVPLLRLPFSWVFFRNFGLRLSKMCSKLALLDCNFLNLYFHNWEFANLASKQFPQIPRLFLRNSGENLGGMLKAYIGWCRQQGLAEQTISEFLRLE